MRAGSGATRERPRAQRAVSESAGEGVAGVGWDRQGLFAVATVGDAPVTDAVTT